MHTRQFRLKRRLPKQERVSNSPPSDIAEIAPQLNCRSSLGQTKRASRARSYSFVHELPYGPFDNFLTSSASGDRPPCSTPNDRALPPARPQPRGDVPEALGGFPLTVRAKQKRMRALPGVFRFLSRCSPPPCRVFPAPFAAILCIGPEIVGKCLAAPAAPPVATQYSTQNRFGACLPVSLVPGPEVMLKPNGRAVCVAIDP